MTVLSWLVGGDSPDVPLGLHQVVARAAIVYVAGLFIVRLGKSRLVGRVSALDILVGFILGSLLSRGITGHASLSATIVASAAIVATHWVFTLLAVRSHGLGTLIKGHPLVLLERGQVNHENMRRSHFSEHDLEEALRLHGVDDIESVARAVKERNGDISVIKRD